MTTFTLDINNFAKKVGAEADKKVREVCLKLYSDITYGTPVDTGRAQANWFTSIGSPSSQTIEYEGGGAAAAGVAIGRSMPDIAKATGNILWITNNLPYIYRLEYEGWSKQAPRGMVRIAIDNMKRDLR